MSLYFVKRILLIIPTFVGITILIFMITRLVPGGPMERAIQARTLSEGHGARTSSQIGSKLTESQLAQLKAYYGLDKAIVPAYFDWLGKILRGDFGKSTRFNDPVLPEILDRIPISLYFGLASLVATYLLSIPLGIRKAMKHRSLSDNVSSSLVFIGYALPGYIVGIILLSIFAFNLGWLPLGGFSSPGFAAMGLWEKIVDRTTHMILPLIAYVIGDFAVITMLMKNSVLENMASDYIKTAIAKGCTFRQAMWRHAFRNSIIPIAAGFGQIITVFLAGSFLIESIFNIRGMGMLGYQALLNQDYPLVMGTLAAASLLALAGNVISDLIVATIDPRIRFGR